MCYSIWPGGPSREDGFFVKSNPVLLPWDIPCATGGAVGSCPTVVWEVLTGFREFIPKIGQKRRFFLMNFGINFAKTTLGL